MKDIAAALNAILADVFALYVKTKNFHWHMSGPHFRDYHLLLDEQAEQLLAMTDPVAERVRKLGGLTLRSIGHISRAQRIVDNDAEYVEPLDMLAELAEDNKATTARLREAHDVCDEHRDVATASLDRSVDRRERTPDLVPVRSDAPKKLILIAGSVTLPNNQLVDFQSTNSGATNRQPPNCQRAKCKCSDGHGANRMCAAFANGRAIFTFVGFILVPHASNYHYASTSPLGGFIHF